MVKEPVLNLTLQSRRVARDDSGRSVWQVVGSPAAWTAGETALLLCDVWDRHWCRGAEERVEAMLDQINRLVTSLRNRGVLIVHAPSETMDFYADATPRKRALDAPKIEPPEELQHDDPPKPVDDSDGGCDTCSGNRGAPGESPWTRQHAAIEIDQDRDVISDDGSELLGVYQQGGVRHVLIAGVHTNFCVLHRTFAIKQMVRWGFEVALVRDLTDAMYNPAKAPYVSHEAGTQLVINYIEAHWCPTVASAELL